MTGSGKHRGGPGQGREDRLLQEWVHDTYKAKSKLPEPTVCPQCNAVFHHGRWQWGETPAGAHETLCPACHRIADGMPAGILTLSGDFLAGHHDEIVHLLRNVEEREKTEHPLKRIMDISEHDGVMVVNFTDPHLARGAGEAVHHAYQGDLDYHYQAGETLLRLTWRR